jgi:uncharacterized protein (DUF934 family)
MTVLVRKSGFVADDIAADAVFRSIDDLAGANGTLLVDLANDQDAGLLVPHLASIALIRLTFPGMADGRAFSQARRLRQLGYTGRLRARGPVIPDQFRAALRLGIDEIEISDEQASRQPEPHWTLVSLAPSYQDRVRSTAA